MKVKLPQITFELTSVCNLKCKYCYNIWKMPGNKNFSHYNSYKQAKKTLKRIFKVADVKHVTFTGGEPFLAERFPELVLYAKMKKKSVTIITNGNSANKTDYKQMLDLKVGLFELPVHSPDTKAHDYMTGITGSWRKSVESIKILIGLNANVVGVIVITKANYKQIAETLVFLKNMGVFRIMLNRFNIGGQGIIEKNNLIISQQELAKTYKIASQTGREHKLALSSNVCTPLCVLNPDDFKNILFSTCSSDIKRRPLTIDIHGDLRFCNHSPTILGNIYKDKISDMLNSEKAQLWDNIIPDFCTGCNLYTKCKAGCRAASEQMKLSLNIPDPIIGFAGHIKP
ncbi:MAG: hypothetical protein B6I20_01435 [Bacteroidetes bacterium 4572_117]|nr:MAG: hypothetical protein B6I20_01435 [Bacteroidetes bacterium 4572_117]